MRSGLKRICGYSHLLKIYALYKCIIYSNGIFYPHIIFYRRWKKCFLFSISNNISHWYLASMVNLVNILLGACFCISRKQANNNCVYLIILQELMLTYTRP